MTDASIEISESGWNSTTLRAVVGNDLSVTWKLTDAQLAHLAQQAVSILKRRADSGVMRATELATTLASTKPAEGA